MPTAKTGASGGGCGGGSPVDIKTERSSVTGQALQSLEKTRQSLSKLVGECVVLLIEDEQPFLEGSVSDPIERELMETLDERIVIACMYLGCNYGIENNVAGLYPVAVNTMGIKFCTSYIDAGEPLQQRLVAVLQELEAL